MTQDLNEIFYDWIPDDVRLYPFYEGVHEFVKKHIDLDRLKTTNTQKEILDPCVGYVKLYGWEVAVLDTELFQRLRKITQLGLAYHVYPTLRYSRFEHTIGVLGRLNQTIQKLLEKHMNDEVPLKLVLEKYETQIRLAALFHDIGHCIFSHLSEGVISELEGINSLEEQYPSVSTIKDVFNRSEYFLDSELSIAEIFSIAIIGSRLIGELLFKSDIHVYSQKNKAKVKNGDWLSDQLMHSARFIAGLPIHDDPNTVFLAQLISSGLDADKLDYMSREEHFSGIKIEMDLVRIFNKIKLFQIQDRSDLPKELARYTDHVNRELHQNYIVLGIEKGGQFSYEEFCVARLALYEKIYLHKKVRAAESFLQKKLEKIHREDKEFKKAHNWLYLVESITERTQYSLLEKATSTQFDIFTNEVEKQVSYKSEIDLSDIEKRQIPYRAYGFGPANAKTDWDYRKIVEEADFTGFDAIGKLDSIRFWNKLNPNKKFKKDEESLVPDFLSKIIQEAIKLLEMLHNIKGKTRPDIVKKLINLFKVSKGENISAELHETYYDVLYNRIIIDVPDYRRVQLKYGSLVFEEASYQTVRWTIPIDQIARYYQLHRILAFVYCDYDLCPLIHLACERVVYDYFPLTRLVFDQTQAVSSEISEAAIEIKQFIIKHSEAYKEYQDILPINKKLRSVSSKDKIISVVNKLNRIIYFDTTPLTYLNVENFIRQFDEPLQIPALNLINSIKVLSNDELTSEVEFLITKLKGSKEKYQIGIIPLGSYFSSAANMMKSYRTFIRENSIATGFLNDEKAALNQNHIIFFDDNINTGRQALNIIAKMLDVDLSPLKRDKVYLKKIMENDGEIDKISDPKIVEHLKKINLSFVFITGHESSAEQLKKYLINYCGLQEEKIDIYIKYILSDEDKIFSGIERKDEKYDSKNIFQKLKKELYISSQELTALKKFLENIGMEVVKNRSICKEYNQDSNYHSLGYCNRESMVVFPSSVPTMTITALWCGGKILNGKKDWKPLIPRPEITEKII